MRKAVLILAAASLALVAFSTSAAAHTATIPTSVTIRFVERPNGDTVFLGRVRSPDPACIENRLVRLYRVAPRPVTLIDTDRSEDDGRWDIDVEGGAAPGNYRARLPARTINTPGHSHRCAAAMSDAVTVP